MANPKFTQKHFRVIADTLRDILEVKWQGSTCVRLTHEQAKVVRLVRDRLAVLFRHDNPKFDRDLFIAVVEGQKSVNALPTRKHLNR